MEQLYTIPVNEAFDDAVDHPEYGCPLCSLYKKLEENELSLILGASMMEPDVRIRTNREGFCGKHYGMMLVRKNRLGMALMLESHLDELSRGIFSLGAQKRMEELENSCYVCSRIEFSLSRMIETVILLWERDGSFREKFARQPHFCLPHYRAMLTVAGHRLGRRDRAEFFRAAGEIERRWFDSLREDISGFCRAFDYRSEGDPSPAEKTAVLRAVNALSGNEGRESHGS